MVAHGWPAIAFMGFDISPAPFGGLCIALATQNSSSTKAVERGASVSLPSGWAKRWTRLRQAKGKPYLPQFAHMKVKAKLLMFSPICCTVLLVPRTYRLFYRPC